MKKNFLNRSEDHQHFSLRKLTIGVASVLLGTTVMIFSNHTVQADVNTNSDQVKTEEISKSADEVNKSSLQVADERVDSSKVTTPVDSDASKVNQKVADSTETTSKSNENKEVVNSKNEEVTDAKNVGTTQDKKAAPQDINNVR